MTPQPREQKGFRVVTRHATATPEPFPRYVMAVCTSCGGQIEASSASPHPSWPRCSCVSPEVPPNV